MMIRHHSLIRNIADDAHTYRSAAFILSKQQLHTLLEKLATMI